MIDWKPLVKIRGERGPRGFPGADGKTPKKGVDYFDGMDGKDGKSVKLEDVVEEILPEVLAKTPQRGGGDMGRNIWINGNSSVLSKYKDINLKPGSNVTITYTNNNSLRTTDITIASSGGGASVGGITRSINTISTSQTAGSAATTDYVYICSAGIQITLPDATASNSNLYTIKNTSTSSVLVNTTGGQTIDGQSNVILATQYTSIDLESDSANWDIT